MILAELTQVNSLETDIRGKQRELCKMYAQRASLLSQLNTYSEKQLKLKNDAELMAQTMYEELVLSLKKYGLKVPLFRTLKQRLIDARQAMDEIEVTWPDSIGTLKTILLPPSRLVPFPITKKWRKAQHSASAHMQDDVFMYGPYRRTARKTWEVLVVSAGPRGISHGEPDRIIKERLYEVGQYDTRALGFEEYSLLSLYLDEPIDVESSTMLLKGYRQKQLVAMARYNSDHYEFYDDDSGMVGVFSDELYRPAVLIR